MASHDFDVESIGIRFQTTTDDDWQPTPHGRFFAAVLHENPSLFDGRDVLELGAGTGIHTIILERGGAARITATEYRADLLVTTKRNMEHHDCGARTQYVEADWLHLEGNFDLIVANPPFCLSGQTNRRYFIDELILNGHRRLREGGGLLFVQSSMAGIDKTLRRLDENGYTAEIVDSTSGPFRDYYYTTPGFLEEARTVPDGFRRVDGKDWETLSAIHARRKS